MEQPRHGGRAASANIARLRHEWRGATRRSWSAGSTPRGAATRVQEREIPGPDHRRGRAEENWQRPRVLIGGRRLLLVRGYLRLRLPNDVRSSDRPLYGRIE